VRTASKVEKIYISLLPLTPLPWCSVNTERWKQVLEWIKERNDLLCQWADSNKESPAVYDSS
jgi:hypothetical protein